MLRRLIGLINGGASERRRKERKKAKNPSLQDLALPKSISQVLWRRHRPYKRLHAEVVWTKGSIATDDDQDIRRLIAAYRYGHDRFRFGEGSTWYLIFEAKQAEAHNALLSGDIGKVRALLANPAGNYVHYGFDILFKDVVETMQKSDADALGYAMIVLDQLIRLGEAIGVLRAECPEHGRWVASAKWTADKLIPIIEAELGFPMACPDIYPMDIGLVTPRGALTYRAVHAMYQAHRLRQLVAGIRGRKARICEIGGGLGRTAYYANLAGIADYTLVDIPFTAASQGYYLMKVMGCGAITLSGETPRTEGGIRILSPEEFFKLEERFDVILNVDSITEFGGGDFTRYMDKIQTITGRFLSINHEQNQPRVIEALRRSERALDFQRHPYWMRTGYVEELATFR
jgi:hypothetical protein